MLAAILAVLFIPLSRALVQVKNETVARSAIREAILQLAARESVVSEMVDIAPDRIRVRLILTDAVPPPKIEQARNLILKRTGRDVDLFVRRVAGAEELTLLRERLKPASPAPLDEAAIAVLRNVLRSRLRLDQLRLEMEWVNPEAPKTPAPPVTLSTVILGAEYSPPCRRSAKCESYRGRRGVSNGGFLSDWPGHHPPSPAPE